MSVPEAPAALRLRPLEIGDLLDETFRMYRRHFVLFAGISVLLSIPAAALYGTAFGVLGALAQQTGTSSQPDLTLLFAMVPVFAFAFLLGIALLPFTFGAVTFAACESALGRPVTPGSIFRGVLRRYFPLLGYWLLFNPFTGEIAALLCLLPLILWLWVFVMWIAATPAMFVENIGLGQALGRSRILTQGRWWRTFLIVLLVGLVFIAVRLALTAFTQVVQFGLDLLVSPLIAAAVASTLAQIVDALVNPILQIAIVLVYFDLRVRREALDLFQMAQQVAMPPVPS